MKSLFGVDMNHDGKVEPVDDFLFMEMVEEDRKTKEKAKRKTQLYSVEEMDLMDED